jgi:WD40 repeat protein
MKILPGHGAGVQSISFHPHQPHILLSGSWDNTVKVRTTMPFTVSAYRRKALEAHALIVVSGVPQLWDVNTSELLGTFDFAGHTSGEQAWAVSISEKGMMLGVGQAGWLCAWDYRQRTPIFAYQPEEMVRVSRDDSTPLLTVAPGSNSRARALLVRHTAP